MNSFPFFLLWVLIKYPFFVFELFFSIFFRWKNFCEFLKNFTFPRENNFREFLFYFLPGINFREKGPKSRKFLGTNTGFLGTNTAIRGTNTGIRGTNTGKLEVEWCTVQVLSKMERLNSKNISHFLHFCFCSRDISEFLLNFVKMPFPSSCVSLRL